MRRPEHRCGWGCWPPTPVQPLEQELLAPRLRSADSSAGRMQLLFAAQLIFPRNSSQEKNVKEAEELFWALVHLFRALMSMS